jgi:hypothetical protein
MTSMEGRLDRLIETAVEQVCSPGKCVLDKLEEALADTRLGMQHRVAEVRAVVAAAGSVEEAAEMRKQFAREVMSRARSTRSRLMMPVRGSVRRERCGCPC